jgi:hypothetical protein
MPMGRWLRARRCTLHGLARDLSWLRNRGCSSYSPGHCSARASPPVCTMMLAPPSVSVIMAVLMAGPMWVSD